MAKHITEWLEEIKPLQEMQEEDPETYYSTWFFRDPMRPRYTDCDFVFSPADGTIIDQGIVKPDEEIAEVKGIQYTPRKLLEDETFDKKALVISIFMSSLDVHTNTAPTNGVFYYRRVDPLQTLNKPMLFEERDILKGHINYADMGYPTKNGRVVNTIINGNYTYYLVQIADSDVDVIAPFSTEQGKHYFQNERFGIVRYGSQVSLILPITDSFDFELIEKPEIHVQAGLDKLVHLKSKPGYSISAKKS
jgi:phosphatidylserine decarboxylase